MIYRAYGKTGKMVSTMGFGGNRFPQELYKTERGIEICAELVNKAYDKGVNYFDLSHTYCDGKCQDIFKNAFSKISDRSSFYIAEKSMLANDPTEKSVRERIERTLKALDTDYLDFFHMWAILDLEQYRQIIKSGGPFEGAYKAKKEGLIRHICFSAHCTGTEIVQIVEDGRFEGVTVSCNIINYEYVQEGIKAAAEAELGIAVMNPLAGGVIPQNPDVFGTMCKTEEDIAETALKFTASIAGVTTVLNGISNECELYSNLKAFEQETTEQMRLHLHDKRGISRELCTGCRYCMGCPEEIPIHKLMLSYNQYLLRDRDSSYLSRYIYDIYGIEGQRIFNCSDCKHCEHLCTQHLPIRQRIKEMNHVAWNYKSALEDKIKGFFHNCEQVKTGVYAAGPYAGRMFSLYKSLYGHMPEQIFLFDSDPRKWGTEPFEKGLIVRKPDEIETLGIEQIIIASEANYNVIYESLQHLEKKGVAILGV